MFTVADLRVFLANNVAGLAAPVLVEDEDGRRRGIESIGWPDAARESGAREVVLKLEPAPASNIAEATVALCNALTGRHTVQLLHEKLDRDAKRDVRCDCRDCVPARACPTCPTITRAFEAFV